MNRSLHLKCLLLNVHLVGLFHTINSQTSDKWKLKRIKNTTVYQLEKQYPNNQDQIDDFHMNNQDQYVKHSGFKPERVSYYNRIIKRKSKPTRRKIPVRSIKVQNIQVNDGIEEQELLDAKSLISMTQLKIGNYSIETKEYSELSHHNCGLTRIKFIVGGKAVTKSSHPWIGTLMLDREFWCSINIINELWVMTAAHCVKDTNITERYSIRVGSIDRRFGTVYNVSKVIGHPNYNQQGSLESDIAMLKIIGPIRLNSRVRPICLPKQSYQTPETGSLLTVAGWGALMSGAPLEDYPFEMREVELKVVPLEECAKKYIKTETKRIYKSQICTHNPHQDACTGDSGGGAIQFIKGRATIVGLVSYGVKCADDFPGVFTKVSYYISWIRQQFQAFGLKLYDVTYTDKL